MFRVRKNVAVQGVAAIATVMSFSLPPVVCLSVVRTHNNTWETRFSDAYYDYTFDTMKVGGFG